MNDTRHLRLRKLPAPHLYGALLVLLAVLLAIPTSIAIAAWSQNPRPLLAQEEAAGVPRNRTGLVATADNRGQVLFGRYCDSCHTGGGEFSGPSLRTDEFKGEFSTADSIIKQVRGGGFDMPAFPPTLISDDDLQQITEFVLSLPKDNP